MVKVTAVLFCFFLCLELRLIDLTNIYSLGKLGVTWWLCRMDWCFIAAMVVFMLLMEVPDMLVMYNIRFVS